MSYINNYNINNMQIKQYFEIYNVQKIILLILYLDWPGLFLFVFFCLNAGYGGTRLGLCWDIVEERYPEHRGRTRNPYPTIAHRAVGRWGRYLILSVFIYEMTQFYLNKSERLQFFSFLKLQFYSLREYIK